MTIVLNNMQIKANKVESFNNIIAVEFLQVAVTCSAVGVKSINEFYLVFERLYLRYYVFKLLS